MITVSVILSSGHTLLIIGLYHSPKFANQEASLIEDITETSDKFLDSNPEGIVLCGKDLNHLDLDTLSVLSGLQALVDFPTRGTAFLDNCMTNRPDLFSTPFSFKALMKTGHLGLV